MATGERAGRGGFGVRSGGIDNDAKKSPHALPEERNRHRGRIKDSLKKDSKSLKIVCY
jgi:hypothetical protein